MTRTNCLSISECSGSNVYSDKRGRPQYSSLIPFPRVGRSPDHAAPRGGMGNMWYYGQKRGGKSGLIPFPRVGRSGANTWDLDLDDAPAEGLNNFDIRGGSIHHPWFSDNGPYTGLA